MFSDEEDQSYLSPALPPSDLITAITASPNTKLYVFTKSYYRSQWRRYIDPTGGDAFILTSRSEQMYNDLMSILDEICLPDDNQALLETQNHSPFMLVSSEVRYDYVFNICL